MSTALTGFLSILVGGVSTVATGVVSGVTSMATGLFLETSEVGAVTGLSAFGGIIALMAGIGFAIGLTSKVWIFITSLAAKK